MRIPKTIKQCSYAIQMQYVSLAPKAREDFLRGIMEYEKFLQEFAKTLPDRFKEDVAAKIRGWRDTNRS